jgi:hypothetical protein
LQLDLGVGRIMQLGFGIKVATLKSHNTRQQY